MQLVAGDWAARTVAATQPVKLAAMEGQFHTQAGAPLRLGGWPDEQARRTRGAVEIPGLLSWLAYGDPHAVVRGLEDFPPQDTPPVAWVHLAFQLMVGAGLALALLAAWVAWSAARYRRLPDTPVFYGAVLAAGPLSVLALEAGWVVTEVGRQPWIVQGVLRTADAVTTAPGIPVVLGITLLVYSFLTVGLVSVLRLLARLPLPEEVGHGS